MSERCPLYPEKRTSLIATGMSALCHKETHAPQQKRSLFDQLIGELYWTNSSGTLCRRTAFQQRPEASEGREAPVYFDRGWQCKKSNSD